MRPHRIIALLILLLLTDIALAKPPVWVEGQSTRFPAVLYLVGVGQGSSRDGANASALATIAKIFRAKIEQQTNDWEKYLQIESRGKTQIEQKKTMELLTRVSTDKVIEGVQIVETAQDGPVYYALAILDRLQATASLTERITDMDENIHEAVHLARNAPDKISRIKNYKRAINTFLLRNAANTDLQIVSIKGMGIPSPLSLMEIAQEFDEWLSKNFLIDVKVAGVHGPVVQKAVIEALLREGFPVNGEKQTGPEPDLLVRGDVVLSPLTLPGKAFKYVRWCVDLTISETKGNKIVGVLTKSGREGHISASEVEARAIRAIPRAIMTDIGGRIAEYFTGALPHAGDVSPILTRSSSCNPAPTRE